jgi:homospermidine synthase
MEIAMPYLGPVISQPVEWMPPAARGLPAAQPGQYSINDVEPWQFKRFQVIWKPSE